MNIMAELLEAWTSKRKTGGLMMRQLAGNPLPHFEQAFRQVHAMIVGTCQKRQCTYAELLEDARNADPATVERYFELFESVDCDVYGKWCAGTLTVEEYTLFCGHVDEWKDSTSRMIKTLEGIPA
jgi:hypothetical protein